MTSVIFRSIFLNFNIHSQRIPKNNYLCTFKNSKARQRTAKLSIKINTLMKKTVLFILLSIGFALTNAQTLLTETFDTGVMPAGWTAIDSDGDGFNWDPASNLLGHDGGLCICSASYDLSGGQGLHPDNWLITPAVTLTGSATLTFYVRGQDPTYCHEHFSVYVSTTGTAVSDFTTPIMTDVTSADWTLKTVDLSAYTGQTVYVAFRHHNTYDEYWMKLDDVTIFAQPTDPTIDVLPNSLEFANVAIPGLGTKAVEVYGLSLPTGAFVSASTSAPFSVSQDGTNFSNTVTMTSANGTVYVRYIPTTAGVDNGTVNFSCTGANPVSMPVIGHGRDCSNMPLPYEFHFDNMEQAYCWTMIDANYDAHNLYGEIYFSLEDGFAVYGFNELNAADDWLISPAFTLGEGTAATFEYSATADMSGYVATEKYEVYAIVNGQPYNEGTLVVAPQECDNTEWLTQLVDLSAFAGQSVQVGIHVISDANAFVFGIQNFTIANGVVGVDSHEWQTSIFPNPASHNLHISTSTPMKNVCLFNLAGQLMGCYDVNGLQTELNVSNLASGMYLLKIETEKGVVNQKFNVTR